MFVPSTIHIRLGRFGSRRVLGRSIDAGPGLAALTRRGHGSGLKGWRSGKPRQSGASGITEFTIPATAAKPLNGIDSGPRRRPPWFITDRGDNAIGMINPTTHAVSLFAVPTANAWPYGITAGPDGNLWFTEAFANKIGMINPNTHAISEFHTSRQHPPGRHRARGTEGTHGRSRREYLVRLGKWRSDR